MWQYNWGFGIFPLFWIIIWVIIVWAIFGHRWDRHMRNGKSAEEILHERFAKGEIDEDEYKKRLEIIRKHYK